MKTKGPEITLSITLKKTNLFIADRDVYEFLSVRS